MASGILLLVDSFVEVVCPDDDDDSDRSGAAEDLERLEGGRFELRLELDGDPDTLELLVAGWRALAADVRVELVGSTITARCATDLLGPCIEVAIGLGTPRNIDADLLSA
ncbi:MAG: hypothetical protein R2698_10725 [Microthrixaceae bacterium]